ncbi:MAG TPA: deoxyribose-phosphate aldolase [Clostridiaceae bacterium]|nr:deoxyribose-phosphate aldolase [Clostridiaceae bacterium]
MEIQKVLKLVDHTLLNVAATWNEIKALCDEGILYDVASVCIPPAYVAKAKEYVGNRLAICTVVGFPNGYSTTEAKIFEAEDAIRNRADEIDMVVNIGLVKSGEFKAVEDEIKSVKSAIGSKILKVIIETCVLTREEKIKMCKVVTNAGADFIKTSTGFSTGGATREDIRLFSENVGGNVKIKAAGGIKTLDDAMDFINLGASRLGTSSLVKYIKENYRSLTKSP